MEVKAMFKELKSDLSASIVVFFVAVLVGFKNRVKLAFKTGGVKPLIFANKKRPVTAFGFVSKMGALQKVKSSIFVIPTC
jgi:hypothetical protein